MPLEVSLCLTNFTPAAPTRGAGRPQGTFVMERLLDRIAETLALTARRGAPPQSHSAGADAVQTRVAQRDGSTMVYDSGDYPECQRRALAAAGWNGFPGAAQAARARGRYIGIGLANYVEGTGRGPFESAGLRIHPSGRIVITTGATAQGQGTKTMLAQIVRDVLSVPPDAIQVIAGDTSASPLGLGAYASRQAVTAGNAVHLAARPCARRRSRPPPTARAVARGARARGWRRAGKACRGCASALGAIAGALMGVPASRCPAICRRGFPPPIDFQPQAMAYNNGTHVCEVEVDIATGPVAITRYVVVHDCGRMINPLMVEGQVLGAVAHGIGATLSSGCNMTRTASRRPRPMPTICCRPRRCRRSRSYTWKSPSPTNPLGVKGAAESGTIGAPAAIVSAVEDALRPFNVRIADLPVTPERLCA